ncbi:MAG TPA: AMP-binding protein [Desulfosalsimonadaceae bacterium]|nr:AMP-binding protein [Desulfosalsimonadaceae bacterium]
MRNSSITRETWAKLRPMAGEDTFPKLLRRNYQNWGGSRVAYRYKDFGIWQELTWRDNYERIRKFAMGLASMGFCRGDRIAIGGENAPEWFFGQIGAQCLGGVSVGLYTDATPKELQYVIDHSEARIVMVDDQEQVDKILSIREELPRVEKLIYWIAKGMWGYEDAWLIAFDDVMELGDEYEKENPGLFDESVERTQADDMAVLLYTSGTTGLPKGTMVSYTNLLSIFNGWDAALPWKPDDENLSFLPPAWIGEQIFTVAPNLMKGVVVNFIEKAETIRADLREVGPRVLLFGARQWEMVCSEIQSKMMDAPWWKKSVYDLFLPVGYRIAKFQEQGQTIPWYWKVLRFCGYWSVFRALQDKIGFQKTRAPITAGAALSPDNLKLLRAIGIPIFQGYGATEVSGLDTVQVQEEYYRPEGSGEPFPGVEIRITEEGEILLGGVGVTHGYFKQPEKTAESFQGGYFYTGDGGYMDDWGELYVVDRVKDMQTLKNGEKFSPTYIEGRLKFSPYIKDCMVVGNNRDFVVAMMNMDYENTGRWAERSHIPYTSHQDLSQKEEVGKLLKDIVKNLNRVLPESQKVVRFVVLHKDFDPDEAELTRTRKLRRDFMENRYETLVSGLYEGQPQVDMETTVTYSDGRQATWKIPIIVHDVEK